MLFRVGLIETLRTCRRDKGILGQTRMDGWPGRATRPAGSPPLPPPRTPCLYNFQLPATDTMTLGNLVIFSKLQTRVFISRC